MPITVEVLSIIDSPNGEGIVDCVFLFRLLSLAGRITPTRANTRRLVSQEPISPPASQMERSSGPPDGSAVLHGVSTVNVDFIYLFIYNVYICRYISVFLFIYVFLAILIRVVS